MSLFEELIEDKKGDKKIIKSFKSKDTLSNQIFEGDKGKFVMRDDIKTALLKIGDDFIESLGVEFFIHDIVLTGSLANYNWSNFSDVDLHIVIKGYDVELYVQDVNEEHVSSGVYSILHNKWIIEPEQKNPNIDDRMILQKGEEYMKKIDNIIEKGKKGVDVLNDIENIRSKIKSFRQSGLDSGGEYSYENLTFKLLRRNGYIGKLLKLKITLTDKKLSVEQ